MNHHPSQDASNEIPSDSDEPPSPEAALALAPNAAAEQDAALHGTLDVVAAPPAAEPLQDWTPVATPSGTVLLVVLGATILAAATFSALSTSLLRVLPIRKSAAPTAPGGYAGSSPLRKRSTGRTETLAASAGILAFVARAFAAVVIFVLALQLFEPTAPSPLRFVKALLFTGTVGGFLLHLTTMSIPLALAQTHSESIVRAGLPMFAPLLHPTTWVARSLAIVRRVLLRAIGTPDASYNTRRLVEGFRAMVEDAEMHGDLGDETRELIANVIEFGEADAAEVMTPRTEIAAIEADSSLQGAIAVFASSGFSRIPVYVETIDTIIGTLTALEAAKAVAEDRVAKTSIRSVMRPPLLVPETQLVPELLGAFRKQRQKMAIVVDEYGGTAGLVTLADVMAEIVGHVQDEFEEQEAPPFQRLADGRVQADASQHVAEINEEASLSIPEEEDYETLAGFVLAEFGRFPQVGNSFTKDGVIYQVSEATDRRVLRVILDRSVGSIALVSELDGDVVQQGPSRGRAVVAPANGSPSPAVSRSVPAFPPEPSAGHPKGSPTDAPSGSSGEAPSAPPSGRNTGPERPPMAS